jgi:hypothetical protein
LDARRAAYRCALIGQAARRLTNDKISVPKQSHQAVSQELLVWHRQTVTCSIEKVLQFDDIGFLQHCGQERT